MISICKYLGHTIRISRDNQTHRLQRRISLGWATYGRLRNTFNSNIPVSLKKGTVRLVRPTTNDLRSRNADIH